MVKQLNGKNVHLTSNQLGKILDYLLSVITNNNYLLFRAMM